MGRKKKYENALIVKDILAREAHALGDMQGSIMFRFIDLKKKDDREFLRKQIEGVVKIFNDALKELEEKNESNDKSADESVEKQKTSKEKEKK